MSLNNKWAYLIKIYFLNEKIISKKSFQFCLQENYWTQLYRRIALFILLIAIFPKLGCEISLSLVS